MPESAEIGGVTYKIRSDYRCILDICAALEDPELEEQDKAVAALVIFYPDLDQMPQERYEEALRWCYWFIDGGRTWADRKGPRLVDWEQDFPCIAAPVNRVLGREIRGPEPLHWWTFLGAYQEIGDCLFAQVVRIRDRRARGKPMDKQDREWYRQNRKLVDFSKKYTSAEEALLKEWGGS